MYRIVIRLIYKILSNSILKVHKPDLEIEPFEDIAVVSKPQVQTENGNIIVIILKTST